MSDALDDSSPTTNGATRKGNFDVATCPPRANAKASGDEKAVLDALDEGVILRDACGRVTFCNQAAIQLLGVEAREVGAGGWDAVITSHVAITSDSNANPASLPGTSACVTGKPEAERVLSVSVRGSRRWIRAKANPHFDDNGALAGSVTVLTDVTELTRLQEASQQSTERLERALEAGNLGVWEFETDTDCGWWSPNLDRLFTLGSRARGFAGLVAHVHQEDRFSLLTSVAHVFQGNDGDRLNLEFRIMHDDGEIRWVRMDGLLTASTIRRSLRGTLVDITERRHIEEQLRKAQRLESIGRLAGGVAHDFNNLLSAMLSSLDLLELEGRESLREDLDNLRNIALRGREQTKRLLAFAKRPFVERKVVNLGEIISGVEVLIRRLVGPSIFLDVAVTNGLPIRGDASLIEQLIVGLAVLARDEIPQGGRLSIVAQRQTNGERYAEMGDELALVTISCTALPRTETSEQTRILDSCKRTLAPSELGLEGLRAIAQQHGGTLTLEASPGQVLHLTLLLPCLPSRGEDEKQLDGARGSPVRRGRVLVIEDEDIVRENLVRLASTLGYVAEGAANAAQALVSIEERGPVWDVVLCDIGMPGRDGPSVVSLLRNYAPSLRVIYMSGYTAEGEFRRADGELFLSKPFGREDSRMRSKLHSFRNETIHG
ncbi:MAG: response regulator [Polyangiaceae bacterium]